MALSLSDYSIPLDPPVPPLLPLCPSYNKQQLISPALFLLDFSKGFDTVRHSALASSLSQLEITDSIYNFIICFLQDRSHVTRFAGLTSVIVLLSMAASCRVLGSVPPHSMLLLPISIPSLPLTP